MTGSPPMTIDAFLADYNAMRVRAETAERERDAALEMMTKLAPGAAEAQRDAMAAALRALVRQLERIGGYSTPDAQAELREARALLVEVGL